MKTLPLRKDDFSVAVSSWKYRVFGAPPLGGKARLAWLVFIVTFFALNVYLFYRYALQINSTGTSQTYADTPALLQAGKYVIAASSFLLCALLSARSFSLRGLEGLLLLIMVVALALAVAHSEIALWAKVFAVIPPAYVAYLVVGGAAERESLVMVCAVLVILHVGYEAFQVASYFASGRLPALAYAGGLVRFGGGWDDPNGFGIWLCLPLAYLLHALLCGQSRSKSAVVLLVAVLLCGALTVSFSAYASYLAVTAVVAVVFRGKGAVWVALLLALVAAVALSTLFFDSIAGVFQGKGGSLEAHSRFSVLSTIGASDLSGLFIGSSGSFSENFYDYMLQAYGIGVVVAFSAVQVYLAWAACGNARRNKGDSFLFATATFLAVMPVAQAMIPHMAVFPVNYLYWCFAFMHLRLHRCESAERKARRRWLRLES